MVALGNVAKNCYIYVMTIPKQISTSDLAALFGIDKRTIAKLAEKQVLQREGRGTFDMGASVRAYVAHREAVVAAEHGTGTYAEARTEWMQEKAAAARIDRVEKQGKLVNVDIVRDQMVSLIGIVRTYFLGCPVKLAPRLVGLKTTVEFQQVLDREVRQILTEISDVAVRSRIRRAARTKREQRVEQGEDDDDEAA